MQLTTRQRIALSNCSKYTNLRLLSKPLELVTEVKQPVVTYPHGKEALCKRA